MIALVVLTCLSFAQAKFTKSIFSHIEAKEAITDYICQFALVDHSTPDFKDVFPNLVAIVSASDEFNKECVDSCDANLQFNKNETASMAAYCAKDKDGNCARALVLGAFSELPSACTPAIHEAPNGDKHFKIDVEFNTAPSMFNIEVRRLGDDQYTCEKQMADKCAIVDACGSKHITMNSREPTDECDADCNANANVCDLVVCHKVNEKCMVSDRLLSYSSSHPDVECTAQGPEMCPSPFNPDFSSAFVYFQSDFMANDAPATFCCAGGAAATNNGTTLAGSGTTAAPAAGTTADSNALVLTTSVAAVLVTILTII